MLSEKKIKKKKYCYKNRKNSIFVQKKIKTRNKFKKRGKPQKIINTF